MEKMKSLSSTVVKKRIILAMLVLCHQMAFGLEIDSIEQWIKVVQERAPKIQAQAEQLKIAERNLNASFGALFPKLDAKTTLTQNHENRDTNDGKTSSADITLTANLYRNHLDWYEYKVAQYRHEIAKVNYIKESGSLILAAINAYLDFSQRAMDLYIAKEKRRLVQEQFNRSRKSFYAGTSTKLENMRLEAEKLSSEFEVDKTESNLSKALSTLKSFASTGADDLVFKPLVFDGSYTIVPITIDLPVQEHFEYKAESLRTKIAEIEVKKAQRLYWPNIDLTTRLGRSVSSFWGPSKEVYADNFTTTLNVTFNLFDGGNLARGVSNKKSELIVQENNMKALELELSARIVQLNEDSFRLGNQMKMAVNVLKIETQVYSAISKEYRVGNIGYLDFINSLNKLLSARANVQSATIAYLKSLYSIRYNRGELP